MQEMVVGDMVEAIWEHVVVRTGIWMWMFQYLEKEWGDAHVRQVRIVGKCGV